MMSAPSILDLVIGVIGFPFQLIDRLVTGFLQILTFDILQLGPFLPIVF